MRKTSCFLLALSALVLAACSADTASTDVTDDELVATFGANASIDLTKTTRIILVGDSDKLSTLPLDAATSRARRYAKVHPDEQVVLFITQDAKGTDVAQTGATIVRTEPFGDGVLLSDLSRLSADKLLSALHQFKRIASIDFFGHSSPFGVLLEASGSNKTLSASVPGNAGILRDNFARDVSPYVTLNGCNGGVHTAPQLSRLWGVPVSGALTAGTFQELKSDNHYYENASAFFPAGLTPAVTNTISYPAEAPRCAAGACVRMKAQDAPYYGVWSNQDTGMQYGLGYYKFFCDFDDSDKSCEKGMASSLFGFVSERPLDPTSSDADARAVLADFFCTHNADPTWFDRCRASLEHAAATGTAFSPMKGRNDYTLECDFQKCEQQFRCDEVNGVPQYRSCAWVAPGCPVGAAPNAPGCAVKNTKKQTTNREYNAYLEGLALLRAEPAPAPTCFSSTLARTVPAQTCVQSKKDNKWYRCDAAGWLPSDGAAGCSAAFHL